MNRPTEPMLLRRQRYRLRASVIVSRLQVCPDWVDHGGVYEGEIDPSSQDFHELRIRLVHPRDPDRTFLVEETSLDEVD